MAGLPDRQAAVLEYLRDGGYTRAEIADELDIKPTTVEYHQNQLSDKGFPSDYERDGDRYEWFLTDAPDEPIDATGDADDEGEALPDLSDTPIADDAPDMDDLTDRERVLVAELQTGATLADLTGRLEERDAIITEHLRELRRSGWKVYIDESAEYIGLETDEPLRSSEHKGTRTRKANRWWELTHSELERRYRELDTPTATPQGDASGAEDWVTHLTDLHAGDEVLGYQGDVVHRTEDLPPMIDYVTRQSLAHAEKHGSNYRATYELWGGDFVTNSGIYEGQFEDLDAWLDEQIDVLHDPLLRRLKALSEAFPEVHVVCQAGNHGDIRASGSSKQANADLILFKSVRNTVAALQECGQLENVEFTIGRAGTPTVFYLRDGEIHGQLRHGQDRDPQATTGARKKEWLSTILDSLNAGTAVDLIWMGHHHVSGRLPWNGPPVLITGSPKPGGEYARKLGEMTGPNVPTIAHAHGVSDDGLTGVYPIDTRHYDPT